MDGLSNVNAPIIKLGAAELTATFADMLDAIKNAPDAYRQMIEEHKALQKTKADHQAILDDNEKLLAQHKASVVIDNEARKKDKIERDKHANEMAERERNLDKLSTSLNVRDSELGKRAKKIADRESVANLKEKEQQDKDIAQEKRAKELNDLADKLAKEKGDWKAKQEALNRVMG